MTIMEVSLITGFYPNQKDLKQVIRVQPAHWCCPGNPHTPRVCPRQHLPRSSPGVNAPRSAAMPSSGCLPA